VLEIYDTDRSAIRIGHSVEISIPSVLNPVSGSISFIDPNGSPTTRSVQARVPLQNPVIRIQGVKQQILERNAYAEGVVEVRLGSALSGNRAVVFVLATADSIVQRPVRIGRRGAAYWEVLDGLTSGESVARTGLLLLEGEMGLGSSQTD
jgi:multidrug efflux pump subunit AcrA (membrane-fusion protein)